MIMAELEPLTPAAPYGIDWGGDQSELGDISLTLTGCTGSSPEDGVFTETDRATFRRFKDGRLKCIPIVFPRLSWGLQQELLMFINRREHPSEALIQAINYRAMLVRQAFGENVGDEF
jgi:hypothetical protein